MSRGVLHNNSLPVEISYIPNMQIWFTQIDHICYHVLILPFILAEASCDVTSSKIPLLFLNDIYCIQ